MLYIRENLLLLSGSLFVSKERQSSAEEQAIQMALL
jgi:hypothetical protein